MGPMGPALYHLISLVLAKPDGGQADSAATDLEIYGLEGENRRFLPPSTSTAQPRATTGGEGLDNTPLFRLIYT